MAMVNEYVIEEVGDTAVTAIGYNAAKRQILLGFQDGSVNAWDIEDNKLVHLTAAKHGGWITAFVYLPHSKMYLIASIDGYITAMQATQRVESIFLEEPIYALAFNQERGHLIAGLSRGVKIFELDESRKSGSVLRKKPLQFAKEHTDIVRCIAMHDGKLYTGGYDRKMIIYETSYASREVMRPLVINSHSHAAGITGLQVVVDSDTRTWILTTCFDKVLRIWSIEGHLVHRLDFPDTITGLCFVAKLDAVWIAARSNKPFVVDLKTAENISAFVDTEQSYDRGDQEQFKFEVTLLRYIPEYMMTVAATNRKHVGLWRYHYSACAITLNTGLSVGGLAYSTTTPTVFYSADNNGDLFKWERSTGNPYLYSKEVIPFNEIAYRRIRKQQKQDNLESFLKFPGSKNDQEEAEEEDADSEDYYDDEEQIIDGKSSSIEIAEQIMAHRSDEVVIEKATQMGPVTKLEFLESLQLMIASCEDGNIYVWKTDEKALEALEALSKYHGAIKAANEAQDSSGDSARTNRLMERMQAYSILVSPEFCETQRERSSSVLSTARSSIIPSSAQAVLPRKPTQAQIVTNLSVQRGEKRTVAMDSYDEQMVTRKLAGYSCTQVLAGHASVVTCFTVVPPRNKSERSELLGDDKLACTYLLSCGWDSRICIWDLQRCALHDVFRNTRPNVRRSGSTTPSSIGRRIESMVMERDLRELACDGVILDLCYCPLRNEFAYASSDKLVYIRRFSPVGSEMVLLGMLQGHADDVTAVRWNPVTDQYVTASEDHTLRVWNGTGLNECLHSFNTSGVAQTIAIDLESGAFVVGDRSGLSVYDSLSLERVQHNRSKPVLDDAKQDDDAEAGPIINTILHIPERRCYVTACSDGCIRVYNAWMRPKKQVIDN